jgi:hypothetical protein
VGHLFVHLPCTWPMIAKVQWGPHNSRRLNGGHKQKKEKRHILIIYRFLVGTTQIRRWNLELEWKRWDFMHKLDGLGKT